jgi:glycosyltransferase involved in cell wall biosynthesis
MISIIICSRTKTISAALSKNIKDTIGCAYELIVIDNSENQYSIFEAYNLGIEKSEGDYLCCIHDDILIHTIGWGNSINLIFNADKNVGLIGVAGAKIKTKMPSAWWDCPEDEKVVNIIQHFSNKEKERWNYGFEKEQNVAVVAIDGVFMAMRKIKHIRFDTEMNGFHNYDLNISFEYKKQGYDIVVTNQILLDHFSSGVFDENWIRATYKIHNLYRKKLPLFVPGNTISKNHEINNAQRFINICLDFGFKKIAVLVWFRLFLLEPFSKFNRIFWKRIRKSILG